MQQTPDKINGVIGYHNGWVSSYDDQIKWRYFGDYEIWLDRTVTGISLTETTTVEIEQPHPVNINTAPKEVLLALFTGVGSKVTPLNDTTVSPVQAQALIDEIKQPITGFPMLEPIISNTLTSITQTRDFILNLFYPRDASESLANIVERHYTGTMPFCYRSFDIYTLNSTGIVNYPSGNQASVTTINEIVDIAPVSDVITWSIESQYDFDKEFYTYLGNPLKMVTYGTLEDEYATNLGGKDTTGAVGREPALSRDFNAGALKLRTAEDGRGNGKGIWGATYSFSDTYDGNPTPQNYNRNSVVRFIADDTPKDIYSGGVEFWIKFNNIPTLANIFDIKQQDYENRLALWYNNGQLVLSVCDATMEEKAAQIRADVTFDKDVWYHIGAFWHGTKYAQLALFVDGRPVGSFGHYDDTGQKILTQWLYLWTADRSVLSAIMTIPGKKSSPNLLHSYLM